MLHRFWQTTQEVLWASLLLAVVGIALGALLYRFAILRAGVRDLGRRARRGADRARVSAVPGDLRAQRDDDRHDRLRRRARAGDPEDASKVWPARAQVLLDVGRSFRLTPSQQFWKILLPAALPSVFVGLRLGLIFAMINIVGVEFLINFGGLGQLINELAERYDLPGHLRGDLLRRS